MRKGWNRKHGRSERGNTRYQKVSVCHGSPHRFAKEEGAEHGRFRDEKMGTGEGAQAFGWGHYTTDVKGVAQSYAEMGIDDSYVAKLLGKTLRSKEANKVFRSIKKKAPTVDDFVIRTLLEIALSEEVGLRTSGFKENKYEYARGDVRYYERSVSELRKELESAPTPERAWTIEQELKHDEERLEIARQRESELNALTREDFLSDALKAKAKEVKVSEERRHLYTAEFETGAGDAALLDWKEALTAEQTERVAEAVERAGHAEEAQALREDAAHGVFYNARELHENDGVLGEATPEGRSKLLLSAGFVGHKFPAQSGGRGDYSQGTNYVLYSGESLRITDSRHWLRDANGEVMGWFDAESGEVAIRENARVDTFLHELFWHGTWAWAKENARLAERGEVAASRKKKHSKPREQFLDETAIATAISSASGKEVSQKLKKLSRDLSEGDKSRSKNFIGDVAEALGVGGKEKSKSVAIKLDIIAIANVVNEIASFYGRSAFSYNGMVRDELLLYVNKSRVKSTAKWLRLPSDSKLRANKVLTEENFAND